MKTQFSKLLLFACAVAYAADQLPSNLLEGNAYRGNISEGDVEDDDYGQGGYDDGLDVTDLSTGDIEEIELNGAPASKVIAKRRNRSVPSSLDLPGVAIEAITLPALQVVNARILQTAANPNIAGSQVKANLERHRSVTSWPTIIKTVSPVGGVATVTIAKADLLAQVAGCKVYTVPMVFFTIAASQLAARPGARFQITFSGKSEFLAPLTATRWQIERSHYGKAVMGRLIPYIRVNDSIDPVLALIADSVDGVYNSDEEISITVDGLSENETLQVVVPGRDSDELRQLCAAWKIRF